MSPTLRHAQLIFFSFINISHQIGCTPSKSFHYLLTIPITRMKSRVKLVEPSSHYLPVPSVSSTGCMHLTPDDPLHPSRRATRFRRAGYYIDTIFISLVSVEGLTP